MTYVIDTGGTGATGTTLAATGAVLHDCTVELAHVSGRLGGRIGADHPPLAAALSEFLFVHGTALQAITTGFAALGRKLTWTAKSALEVEIRNAHELGAGACKVPAG
jgi:hypothetical protein